ncbi:MAG: hypothetical protein U0R64_02470 [Candidatus Nanopelagicales bacterium]
MTWQFAVLALLILVVFSVMGATLVTRSVLRRRVKRANRELPECRYSGPAVLVGTSVSDDLSGVGVLGITVDELVFVIGRTKEHLTMPLGALAATGYRQSERQRTPSLRVEWLGNAAVFDVQKPGVAEWLAELGSPVPPPRD